MTENTGFMSGAVHGNEVGAIQRTKSDCVPELQGDRLLKFRGEVTPLEGPPHSSAMSGGRIMGQS